MLNFAGATCSDAEGKGIDPSNSSKGGVKEESGDEEEEKIYAFQFACYFFPSKDVILSSSLSIDFILLSCYHYYQQYGLFFSLFHE